MKTERNDRAQHIQELANRVAATIRNYTLEHDIEELASVVTGALVNVLGTALMQYHEQPDDAVTEVVAHLRTVLLVRKVARGK